MAEISQETPLILQISKLIERDDLQTALETPTSIFKLPLSITQQNPESYFPLTLSLGPYHHFHPQFYKSELYKLETAKEALQIFHLPNLNQIVDELKPLELKIQACFDRYLEKMESDSFYLKMAIDGLFLLSLLAHGGYTPFQFLIFKFPLPIFEGQKLYHDVNGNLNSQYNIVNDILKLENQIPFLVLKQILPRNNLHVPFYQFCALVSPISLLSFEYYNMSSMVSYLSRIFERSHHLLHFLYLLIINQNQIAIDSPVGMAGVGSLFVEFLNILASVFQLNQLTESISLIQSLLGLLRKQNHEIPSSIIPSASKLEKLGLKFKPLNGMGIKSSRFDKETATLTLPSVTFNPFSEVIFRNLLAFEAVANVNEEDDDRHCFTQYIALMSALMAETEDAVVLKKAGIVWIYREFNSDEEEGIKMLDDLRKSIIGSKVGRFMDCNELGSDSKPKMIEIMEEINVFYESCWRVKVKRFIEKYVFPLVKALFFIVVVLLIVLVIVRTFCGWFSCPKIIHLH